MTEGEHCRYCGSPRDHKSDKPWRCRRCGALVPWLDQPPHGEPIQFGPYSLVRRIAAGGMGVVYEARRETVQGFEKTFALKRLLPSLGSDDNFVNMLVDEAKICAPLEHPNIVQIFELERLGSEYFIAMEYVPGGTLATLLRFTAATRRLIPTPVVTYILGEAIKGLAHAHGNNYGSGAIIHRDVSPQNIMLSRNGQIKLTDFGIAKAMASSTVSRAGTLKGKLAYMAPEILSGERVAPATDVFAMGVLMHEAFTSRRLFRADSEAALISTVLRGKVPPLRKFRDDVPSKVERVIQKALAKTKEARYSTAVELRDDFLNAIAGDAQGKGLQIAERYIAEYYKIVGLPGEPLSPANDQPLGTQVPIPVAPNDHDQGFANVRTQPSVIIPKQGMRLTSKFAVIASGLLGLIGIITAITFWALHQGPSTTIMDAAIADANAGNQTQTVDAAKSDPDVDAALPDSAVATDSTTNGNAKNGNANKAKPQPPIRNKLDTKDIIKVFKRHITAFNRCGAKAPEQASTHDVKVAISINSKGRVTSSAVQPSSLKGSALESCLRKEIKRMRFPRHRQKTVRVTVPLQFQVE